MIPHSRPRFGAAFEQALLRTLASGYVLMGSEVAKLESELGSYLGRGAAAVDSGTAALELALRALAFDHPTGKVGIPAYSCTSVLHAVVNAGCQPVLMDCGDDLCLLPETALACAQTLDVVVLVHPFGMVEPLAQADWPCPVIEDIAQSAGAVLEGRPVGSFGHAAIASFHATKPWGGAYGGMVLADEAMVRQVRMMRDPDHGGEMPDYAGHHQLSDLHAAMARCRFAQAQAEALLRRDVADLLSNFFEDVADAEVLCGRRGNDYRFLVRVEQAESLISHLRDQGVMAARPVQTPLCTVVAGDCPGAERAWRQVVSLPLLADMCPDEIAQMKRAVKQWKA